MKKGPADRMSIYRMEKKMENNNEEIRTEEINNGFEQEPAAAKEPAETVPEWRRSPDLLNSYSPEIKDKPKKEKKTGKTIAIVLICLIIGALLGIGGMSIVNKNQEPEVIEEVIPEPIEEILGDEDVPEIVEDVPPAEEAEEPEISAADVYEANVNSTVGITTSMTTNYWGYETLASASGSGFVFSEDGYIITNYHVVEDSDSITVSLYDGSTYPAELIGFDPSNDIALIKVEAEGLTPVTIGDSSDLRVGEDVLAIGNPLGELTFSLTRGIVSALDREVTVSSGVTMKLIQTDCAINSGNSGGALFNMNGEVVGITNAKYSSSGYGEASIDNIGFAIPVNKIMPIINSIIDKGYISKPYIGISVSSVGVEAQSYGTPAGASVQVINEGSPAEKAGLQLNDIITAVDDKEVSNSSDLVDIISASNPGDTFKLTVYRKGETITVTITVDEKVQEALPEVEETPAPEMTPDQQSPWGNDWGGNWGDWGDWGSDEGGNSFSGMFEDLLPFFFGN